MSVRTTAPARGPIVASLDALPPLPAAPAPTPRSAVEEQARIRARAAVLRASSAALRGRAAQARAGSQAARTRDCAFSIGSHA